MERDRGKLAAYFFPYNVGSGLPHDGPSLSIIDCLKALDVSASTLSVLTRALSSRTKCQPLPFHVCMENVLASGAWGGCICRVRHVALLIVRERDGLSVGALPVGDSSRDDRF